MIRLRTLGALLLALALAACSAPAPQATPEPGPAGEAVRGEELPGRLLFARGAVVWQWQGREARPLIAGAAQPAFSPDGERIAYIVRADGASDLMLADRRGAPLARLTQNSGQAPPTSLERVYESMWAFYPAWSPDGGELVVAAQPAPPEGDPPAEYALGLYAVGAGGGAGRPVYAEGGVTCGRSAIGPGGELVFVRTGDGAGGEQRLFRLGADGAPEPLAGAPTPSYDPAFSPDGRWLAFAGRADERTDIFVLPAGGAGAPLRLSDLGAARAPAFSPDGRLLAFLAVSPGEAGFDLWVAELRADAAGALLAGEPRRVSRGLAIDADSGLSWAP